MDTVIDLEDKVEDVKVEQGERDCFERERTSQELIERDKHRQNVFLVILVCLYLIATVTFLILMIANLPINSPASELFIVSTVITAMTIGIPVSTVIGFALFVLGNCTYDLF